MPDKPQEPTPGAPRIAIIGSGAAGSSAAWRLRALLGPAAQIEVFEKAPEVGGRAHHIEFAGEQVELGGTLIHTDNRRLLSIAEELGIELKSRSDNSAQAGDLVLWDGQRALVRSSMAGVRLPLALIRRYGPFNLLRLQRLAKAAKANWNSVYGLQDAGRIFERPEDLLDAAGLTPYLGLTLAQAASQQKISPALIDQFVTGVLRDMYNQGSAVVALSGLVALAGAGLAGGSLVAVADGNSTLFAKALNRIQAKTHLSAGVSAVTVAGGSVLVKAGGGPAQPFDSVIIAAPLELANIQITGPAGDPLVTDLGRRYQDVHTTVVAGQITPEFFGPGAAPGDVLTVDQPSIGFKALGRIGYSRELGVPIWKFFSGEALAESVLEGVFRKVQAVHRHLWQAYPVLAPEPRFRPFRLIRGVYQINDFESAVSTLETEATAGWSVADLVSQDLRAPEAS
ncbi:MAG: FAD-dependent oxidoreductase [Bifidobacteriaceae bacterium]|jgi:prenylcysteine oxidase/farnesylcysteine lyase|nr:FAD-dependent oxidoreductase [Bifidobacteriaceae bacterium]